jgi:CubicO group peptidase (beta-lactamase class C family)
MYRKNHSTDKWGARIAALIGLPLMAFTLACPAFPKGISSKRFNPNTQVDQIFAQWDKPNSPGCALAVRKADNIVYQRGYGIADLDHNIPIKPATVFHAASLAKQFTAMSIMLLVGQGRLSLTDEVHALIPDLANISQQITIGDMLHHISGIRDQWALITMAGWRLSDDVIKQNDVLNLVKRMKTLNFDPRSKFSYSNTNYTLAGLIVKRVSGESLPEFARKYIFGPLGMTSTAIIETHGQIVNNRAYGYRGTYPIFEIRMPNYDLTGPTNILTTVEDLMRWDRNFDSKVVGGDAALLAMQTPVAHSDNYGLGLYISSENGRRIVEHDGRDAGYRSHLIRFPDQRLSVALLCNVLLPDAAPTRLLVRKVAAIYLADQLAEEPQDVAESPGVSFTPADPTEYVGRYYSDEIDTTYEIKLTGSSLKITRPRYDPTDLTPLAPDKFKISNFSVVLTLATVQFSRDAGGKINGFRMDDVSGGNRLTNFPFIRRP